MLSLVFSRDQFISELTFLTFFPFLKIRRSISSRTALKLISISPLTEEKPGTKSANIDGFRAKMAMAWLGWSGMSGPARGQLCSCGGSVGDGSSANHRPALGEVV